MDLRMPEPTKSTSNSLTDYKVLSFDVYGSLIEYKGHILQSFQPLLERLPASSAYHSPELIAPDVSGSATVGQVAFLRLFQKEEDAIKLETPVRRFDEILSEIWRRIAVRLEVQTSEQEAAHFGSESVIASWPCFPGTIDALRSLGRHYRLIALSNIDPYAWEITSKSAFDGLKWWKVFTAADFGDDLQNADKAKLETCIEFCRKSGYEKDDLLHVAQSLGHDHAPAKLVGLDSAWLIGDGPRWGKREESEMVLEKKLVGYKWKAQNLMEFAAMVDDEWNKASSR